MTIEELKRRGLILFEAVSGSKAYGLDGPTSDTDIKGVFYLPLDIFLGLEYIPQVSDAKNDTVYYEIGRFVELLSKSNPTALELLWAPTSYVGIKKDVMELLEPSFFLTKKCKDTFAGYAKTQISKASGLNKKINEPIPVARKEVLDFCFVAKEGKSVKVMDFLNEIGANQQDVGLSKLNHMPNAYSLFVGEGYKGMIQSENSNDLSASCIEKGAQAKATLVFNRDAYSRHCKRFKEYWEWVEKRNENRYAVTQAHKKGYDTKNMMHTIRLLKMALEIGLEEKVNVHRTDREELLQIKSGFFSFDEVLAQSHGLLEKIDQAFAHSSLQENVDVEQANRLLIEMRQRIYRSDLAAGLNGED